MRDGSDRMAPRPGSTPLSLGALLGGLLLLGGCTGFNNATADLANGISNAGGRMNAPWGSSTPRLPEEALTVERVRYAAAPPNQLSPEAGDVWPRAMPPRSTLANPDAALRGIPDYQPPSGVAAPPSTGASAIPRPPGPNRGSSSPPPPPMSLPPPTEQLSVPPPQPRSIPQMPPRADGQVITPPSGPPVVTSGGTDRVQSFNVPGGGTGTAIRDGNTTTLIGPDGRVQVVPSTPR